MTEMEVVSLQYILSEHKKALSEREDGTAQERLIPGAGWHAGEQP